MPKCATLVVNVRAGRNVKTKEALDVTISFHARPKDEYDLSENEHDLIVCRLNDAIDWGNFRAVSLNYFGHPNAASIRITIVYRDSRRRRLEILEIGNPSVPLMARQLEDIGDALEPLWERHLSA